MSLLMQALKKAERAKQNNLPEGELEKPSEAFDHILELAQQETITLKPACNLALEPASDLSLEPLGDIPAPGPASVAEPAPLPDFTPRPEKATAAPVEKTAEAARKTDPPPRPRAARAKAMPPRAPVTIDPGTVRLALLGGILLLLICGFAFWFWRATTGPGAGGKLPPVPMPLTDAPGSDALAAGPVLVLPSTAETPPPAAPRRDERTEQQQQQQQQAMQMAAQQAQAQAEAMAHAAALQQQATLPPVMAADNSEIHVLRSDVAPHINPRLQSGYQAFTAGDTVAARQQYDSVLQQEPNNRDALLGLAAVAVRERQGPQAATLYVRLLELDPNDAEALSGLIGLRQGDTLHSETRLKAILQRTPDSGPVLFALGNLYAQQKRWPEAQQQFFRAYSVTPGNADYAFNLAVGLDRLNQGKLALTYYQRALALGQNSPGAFDRSAMRRRMRELGAAPLNLPAPATAAPPQE